MGNEEEKIKEWEQWTKETFGDEDDKNWKTRKKDFN